MGSLQEVPSRATEVVAQPGDGRDPLSQAPDLQGRRRPLALPRTRAGPEQLVVGGRGGKSERRLSDPRRVVPPREPSSSRK